MPLKYLQIIAGSSVPDGSNWGYLPYIFITIGNIIWVLSWIYVNEHKINNS